MPIRVEVPPDRTLADLSPDERAVHSMIWGDPGSGKTVLLSTFPGVHILNTDADIGDSVYWAIKEGICPHKPEEVIISDVYEGLTDDEKGEYGFIKKPIALDRMQQKVNDWFSEGRLSDASTTLGLNSASAANLMMLRKGIEGYGEIKRSESWAHSKRLQVLVRGIQDYNPAKAYFQQFAEWMRSLPCNVVIVAHTHEETNEAGFTTGYYPLLIGSLRQEIPGMLNEVWYMEAEGDTKGKPSRVMYTNPFGKVKVAKSRMGFLPHKVVNPTYAKIVKARQLYYSGAGQDEIEAVLSADPRTVRL
jgi:hypothetical protein